MKTYVFMSICFFVILFFLSFSFFQVNGISMLNTFSPGEIVLIRNIYIFCEKPKKNDFLVMKVHEMNKIIIKRCVAVPRDTISIKDGFLYINSRIYILPPTAFPTMNHLSKIDFFSLNDSISLFQNKKSVLRNDSVQILPINYSNSLALASILDSNTNFIIPFNGMKNYFRSDNIYQKLIRYYVNDSIFAHDYYFVLGDNLLHSMDSRHLGLIKGEDIIGKVIF